MAAEREEQAEAFARELERLLRGEHVTAAGEAGEALQAAELLARGRPAPEPGFHEALKARLLRRLQGAESPLPEQRAPLSEAAPPPYPLPLQGPTHSHRTPSPYPPYGGSEAGAPAPRLPIRGPSPCRRTSLLRTAAALALIFLLALAYTGPLATAARAVQAVLRSVRLGTYTEVVQVPTLTATAALADPAAPRWEVGFAGVEFSGPLFAGGSSTARTLTLEQARQEAGFAVRCPAGLTFREARLIHDGLQARLFLFYQGPAGALLLYQSPVGRVQPAPAPEPRATPAAPGAAPETASVSLSRIYTEGPLVETTAGGRPAVWMAQSALLTWEAEGIHYTLAGPGLTLAQARQIAGSLR